MNTIYYTVKEVASHFRVHPETIRQWLRKKKITGTKIGYRILISIEEIRRIEKEGIE